MIDQLTVGRLKSFFAAYFHEDWAEDAESPSAVLEEFLAENRSSSQLQGLSDDLSAYLAARDDSQLARSLLEELGCYYDPSADQIGVREWLHSVALTLRARAKS